ncbi:hypothetical protein BKA58DRAFT_96940 [Alternaria rosae]|uniref:uncharacterized protein n=1 Tax=Alternaria rosae TaxID=1187941 RepID=UPI001E8D8F0E|nr:uncharacterized protein BKA58DRAFT_96940 [Alternaria rosae]KAH6878512.1 hypothetical protein BKA58DRAFT_96940 [Alternaria rosae]
MDAPTLFKFYTTSLIAFTAYNMEDESPICAVSYREALSDVPQDVVVTTPCRHTFHRGCLDPWLKDGPGVVATCPCCRRYLCKRPLPDRGIAIRCLDPALSDNWAEEKWEGIWVMERLMSPEVTEMLHGFVDQLFVHFCDREEDAAGRLPTGLALYDVFERAFTQYKDTLRGVCLQRSFVMSEEARVREVSTMVYPGGPGQYVAVRTILRAITKSIRERGWYDPAVLIVLDLFREWEGDESMNIVSAYRRVGFVALADGAEEEAERRSGEAFGDDMLGSLRTFR